MWLSFEAGSVVLHLRVISEVMTIRISVLGVGSIGTVIAGALAATSAELHLHVRGGAERFRWFRASKFPGTPP